MALQLLSLEPPPSVELAAGWLSRPENYQWLDFGSGVQQLSPASLRIMAQRPIHELRLFASDQGEPIGVVGLSNIDRNFGTGSAWIVLGDKRYAGQGYGTRAMSAILRHGFRELGLRAASAWALENNTPSVRMLKRVGFRYAGRLRRSHIIHGRTVDRLFFDMLAEEHEEID